MDAITIPLEDGQLGLLREVAGRLGVSPEQLVRAEIEGLISRRDSAFEAAAERVLAKNGELYRRLA